MAVLEVRHCHGHPCELSPGTVLHLPYAEALHVIEEEWDEWLQAHLGALHPQCEKIGIRPEKSRVWLR